MLCLCFYPRKSVLAVFLKKGVMLHNSNHRDLSHDSPMSLDFFFLAFPFLKGACVPQGSMKSCVTFGPQTSRKHWRSKASMMDHRCIVWTVNEYLTKECSVYFFNTKNNKSTADYNSAGLVPRTAP